MGVEENPDSVAAESDEVERRLEREARSRVGTILLNKYKMESLLAMGGMAAVYAAKHTGNNNRVAIKVLHAMFVENEQVRTRFIREGRIANDVEHPAVVRVIDNDEHEGVPFLVMDLLRGQTLEDVVRAQGPLPISDVVRYGCELLEVLDTAHAKGIVHRDLKPQNLFVRDDGKLMVLDFGIARVQTASAADRTKVGLMLGSWGFMAPEQMSGATDLVGPRTDLWAVGSSLFFIAAGRPLEFPKTPLEDCAPELPVELRTVLERALESEIEKRWPSAREMYDALRAIRPPTEPPKEGGLSAPPAAPVGSQSVGRISTAGRISQTSKGTPKPAPQQPSAPLPRLNKTDIEATSASALPLHAFPRLNQTDVSAEPTQLQGEESKPQKAQPSVSEKPKKKERSSSKNLDRESGKSVEKDRESGQNLDAPKDRDSARDRETVHTVPPNNMENVWKKNGHWIVAGIAAIVVLAVMLWRLFAAPS